MGGRSDETDDTRDGDSTHDRSDEADAGEGTPTAGNAGRTDDTGPQREQPAERNDRSRSVFDRFEQLTLFRALLLIVAVALLLRLVALGARAAHWDEARVAYWAQFYTDTGSLAYHHEEHGPLVQLVAGRLFGVFGTNDFVARFPVAIVGGLLPLGAYLYREHLRRTEVIALALFLSLNSVLLYYSRFMRSDVLVAAFMFVAFGLFVRFYDTRRARYIYAAGLVMALGFASKENAIVYLLTWGGAAALVTDQYLHSPASGETGLDRIRARYDSYRGSARLVLARLDYLIGFVLVFLGTIVFTFAPRGDGLSRRLNANPTDETLNLGTAITQPTQLPDLVDETLRSTYEGFGEWFGESTERTFDSYITFLTDGYLDVLVEYTPLLLVFGLLGIAIERYATERSRPLVMFMTYCAGASLVGYPFGAHVTGDWAWVSTHIVVPFTIPAAVGLSWAYRTGKHEVETRNIEPKAVLALVAVVALLWFWMIPVQAVYVDHKAPDNELVQYAQPNSNLDPMVNTLDDIAAEHNSDDVVLFYGQDRSQYNADEALIERDIRPETLGGWQIHPICSIWSNSQPLNWYFAATDADATCEREADALATMAQEDQPPMIITIPDDSTLPAETLDAEYESQNYYLRSIGMEIVVYTHDSWR